MSAECWQKRVHRWVEQLDGRTRARSMASLVCAPRASRDESGGAQRGTERASKNGTTASPGAAQGPKTAKTCAGQSVALSLWMSGALKLDVLREGRSQALLGAKARAGVPGRTKHGAAMGLDPAAKGVGNSLVGSGRLRAPLLEERRSVMTGDAPHSFGQQTKAMGDTPTTLKPLRAPVRDVATAKAPSHDPNTADLASEANRADNGMRTGTRGSRECLQ
ncbi:hypothetical protein, conserved in T. vivax [Trypanosoma vivax Y486]|uniref:Uncharacterized protein n=1 Tax=Trypanosoma vivax (strain Y486) TaxID=1055687 RepID=F9WRR3_TRYVY|nr:hypothetical protein, conserved in T. vivax [Trypanosoma vivax Y486]|eukprot:CCD20247.1 hypothetical protein, conserved in T. vivax [Trypanosoma vivax Y486]